MDIPIKMIKSIVTVWRWKKDGYVKFKGELEVNPMNDNSSLVVIEEEE